MAARMLGVIAAVWLQGSAAQPACADSETWHKKNSLQKTCEWVADFHWKRCRAKGQDGTFAWYSCPETCSACSCADRGEWHVTEEEDQGCAWVADFPPNRCQAKGWDGTFAYESCPLSCSMRCEGLEATYKPTALPTVAAQPETYTPTTVETYMPTEEHDNGGDCEDSDSWHKRNEPSQTCEWVAEWAPRCQARSDDGTYAWWACPGTCSAKCREASAAVLFEDEEDEEEDDDAALGESASRRLQLIAPESLGCRDDEAWHKKSQPDRTCDWVAEFPKRCRAKGQDETFAWYSCPATCSACSCNDVEEWHVKDEEDQGCAWVADFPPNRCEARGEDGTFAYESCPRSCSTLCEGLPETYAPTAMPTGPPTAETYAPTTVETYAPSSGPLEESTYVPTEQPDNGGDCEDSDSWHKKGKPSQNCEWAAEWPPRCRARDEDGTYAWWACPGACSDACAPTEVETEVPRLPPRSLRAEENAKFAAPKP